VVVRFETLHVAGHRLNRPKAALLTGKVRGAARLGKELVGRLVPDGRRLPVFFEEVGGVGGRPVEPEGAGRLGLDLFKRADIDAAAGEEGGLHATAGTPRR